MHYTYVGSVYALSRTKTREGFGYIGYQKILHEDRAEGINVACYSVHRG